jgi:rhodanese-related sulfurtransferase
MNRTSALFVGSLLSICILFTGCENNNEDDLVSAEIDPSSVNELINDKYTVLIDVRTADEYNSGHLSDAVNIPLSRLQKSIRENEEITPDDEIIVYCRSGRRSMNAYHILNELGYLNVKSMEGGIIKWASLGYKTCTGLNMTC